MKKLLAVLLLAISSTVWAHGIQISNVTAPPATAAPGGTFVVSATAAYVFGNDCAPAVNIYTTGACSGGTGGAGVYGNGAYWQHNTTWMCGGTVSYSPTITMKNPVLITDSPCTVHYQVESQTNAIPLNPTDQYKDLTYGSTYVVQTITVTTAAPATAVYNTTFPIAATADSGQTVSVSVSGGCTSSSITSLATITMTSGTTACTITESSPAVGPFQAATNVVSTVTAVKANQTISFTTSAPVGAVIDVGSYAAAATSTSLLAVTLSIDAASSSVCSIAAGVVSFTSNGTCIIDANQSGNANYSAAAQVQQSFTIGLRSFDVVEQGAARGTHLYTKLAGVPFNVDALVGSASGFSTHYTGAVTLELIDYSSGCGTPGDAKAVGSVSFSPAIAYSFVVGDAGRKTFTVTSSKAVANARIRISDNAGSIAGCSSDGFTVRPTLFSMALSNAANPLIAGKSTDGNATAFTITANAKAGCVSYNPCVSTANLTGGYSGIPVVADWTQVTDWTGAALPATAYTSNLITGTFNAGNGNPVVAVDNLYFDDFGTLTFSNTNNLFVDKTFTANSGDIANGDCDSSVSPYSNDLVSGKYGCYIGSTPPASRTTNRFRPFYYYASSGVGAPSCGFTYVGQAFAGGSLTLTAKSGSNTVMTRLNGNSLNTGAAPYPPAYYVVPTDSGVAISDSLTFSPALPTSTTPASNWSAGTVSVSTSGYAIARPTTTVGPYANFAISIAVNDHDSTRITNTACFDNTGHNGTVANSSTVSICSPPTGANGTAPVNYGMIKLDNAYGSELLPLYVTVKALIWNGTGWSTNTNDSCTTILATNIAVGNYTAGINATNLVPPTTLILTGGSGSLKFKISPALAGSVGSADISINLGATGTDSSCTSGLVAGAGANMSWMRGKWCGNSGATKDPNARITFGVSKSPFLYRREKY